MFAAPASCRTYHAPRCSSSHLGLAERVGLVGEVAAEDDRVGPHVANHVRREVRGHGCAKCLRSAARGLPAAPARDVQRGGREAAHQRPRDVVLDDLAARLAEDALQLPLYLRLRLLALLDRLEVEVVQCDAPLEERRQREVVERLEQVHGMPVLVRVDAHDLVAEVAVLAADVRERVVHVVVRVLPRLRGRRRVPVPGGGVDVRIVHPVPLAVQHVVADLHVLEDLRQRQRRGARPARPAGGARTAAPRGSAPAAGGASRSCSRCSGGRARRGPRRRRRGWRRTRGASSSICSGLR